MSMGIGAFAELSAADGETAVYRYGSYNLNDERYRNKNRVRDGFITISVSCFAEPEKHEKIKRMPNGKKKLITKTVPVKVDYGDMPDKGLIEIQNCSNCWEMAGKSATTDRMALILLHDIFQEYQKQSRIPTCISCNM